MTSINPEIALDRLSLLDDAYNGVKRSNPNTPLDIRSILEDPSTAIVPKRGLFRRVKDWFHFSGMKTLTVRTTSGEKVIPFGEAARDKKSNDRILRQLFKEAISLDVPEIRLDPSKHEKIQKAVRFALTEDNEECLNILRDHVYDQVTKATSLSEIVALLNWGSLQTIMELDPETAVATILAQMKKLGEGATQHTLQFAHVYAMLMHRRWGIEIVKLKEFSANPDQQLASLRRQIDADLTTVEPKTARPALEIQKMATLFEAQAIFNLPNLVTEAKALINTLSSYPDKEAAYLTLQMIWPDINELASWLETPELKECQERLKTLLQELSSQLDTRTKTAGVAQGILSWSKTVWFANWRPALYGAMGGAALGIRGGVTGALLGAASGAAVALTMKQADTIITPVANLCGTGAALVAQRAGFSGTTQAQVRKVTAEATKAGIFLILSTAVRRFFDRIFTRRPPPPSKTQISTPPSETQSQIPRPLKPNEVFITVKQDKQEPFIGIERGKIFDMGDGKTVEYTVILSEADYLKLRDSPSLEIHVFHIGKDVAPIQQPQSVFRPKIPVEHLPLGKDEQLVQITYEKDSVEKPAARWTSQEVEVKPGVWRFQAIIPKEELQTLQSNAAGAHPDFFSIETVRELPPASSQTLTDGKIPEVFRHRAWNRTLWDSHVIRTKIMQES